MNTTCSHPEISVIIPIYNAEAFLHRCLESLTKQTYTDYEIILIDDGSQDKSRDICTQFCETDARFRLIAQPNAGVDKARNAGLKAARGEYVTFMDSDDWAEIGWLQAYIDAQKECPCDLLVQGTVVDDSVSCRRETLPEKKYQGKAVLEGVMALEKRSLSGFVHNKMYRTAIIREQNLTFEFTLKEDLLFNLRYNNYIHSMNIIEQAHYHYMQHSGPSLIKKRYPPHQMLALFTALKEAGLTLAERYQSPEYTQFTWQRYLSEYAIQIAGLYNKQHGVASKKTRIDFIKRYQQEVKENPHSKPVYQSRIQAIYAKISLLPPLLCDFALALLLSIVCRRYK